MDAKPRKDLNGDSEAVRITFGMLGLVCAGVASLHFIAASSLKAEQQAAAAAKTLAARQAPKPVHKQEIPKTLPATERFAVLAKCPRATSGPAQPKMACTP